LGEEVVSIKVWSVKETEIFRT